MRPAEASLLLTVKASPREPAEAFILLSAEAFVCFHEQRTYCFLMKLCRLFKVQCVSGSKSSVPCLQIVSFIRKVVCFGCRDQGVQSVHCTLAQDVLTVAAKKHGCTQVYC